jgi:hypothetical protein
MIVFNITMKIDKDIHDAWLRWQKEEHGPETMACGSFTGYKFFRLLEQDETDGITYVLQYFSNDYDDYKKYINEFHLILQQKEFSKWGHHVLAFHTVMKNVH